MLLAGHVIFAVSLIGSTTGTLVLALIARAQNAAAAHTIYDAISTLIYVIDIPLTLIALGTGITLGLRGKWGIFRYTWVITKLALVLAIIFTGWLAVMPATQHLINLTAHTLGASAGRLGIAGWQLPGIAVINILFAATAAVLGIFKPGGRARRLGLVRRNGSASR